jgi:hypothetical protein
MPAVVYLPLFHVDLEELTQILPFFSGNSAAAVRIARKQRSGFPVRAWDSSILLWTRPTIRATYPLPFVPAAA